MKPTQYTARTDFATVPISKLPPIPLRGMTALDPDFGAEILRVTGPGFNPALPTFSFSAGVGGSADVNVWNRASTKFTFCDQGNRVYVMGFAPGKMRLLPLYPQAFKQGTFCIEGGGHAVFAHYGDILFNFDGLRISQYVFSALSKTPPEPSLVCDLSTVLPNYKVIWQSLGGASADGKTFAVALSNLGGQGTGTTIMVWRVGKGWRRFDTHSGIVAGQWGEQGTIRSADRFTIHNIKISPGGDWLVIATALVDDDSIKNKHFWKIDSLDMSVVDGATAGHFTQGYSHWINAGGVPFGQYQSRAFTAPEGPVSLLSAMPPAKLKPILDSHLSWNNCDPADSAPFFATTTSPNPDWQPWQNEVLGFQGGKVLRFCHTMNTGRSPLFSIANAIGSVSQDGRFMLFCSDWMGQTRGDVFIVALK